MRWILATAAVTVLSLQFVACKKEATKTTSPAATGTAALIGTWQFTCKDEANGSPTSYIDTYTFTATQLVSTTVYHSGLGCASPLEQTVATYNYTLESSTVSGASNFNTTLVSATHALKTPDLVKAFNASEDGLYGYKDWVLNGAKDVTGKKQDSADSSVVYSAGRKFYSLLKIDGAKLYFALSTGANDGSTEAKRQTSIDTASPAVKQ